MNVNLTIDDLPNDRASCANCTYNGPMCERKKKQFPDGHVKNSVTGQIAGIISLCVNYKGRFDLSQLNLF